MNIFVLDGKSMASREEAYAEIARILRFPDWFGSNLDALADCLGELPPNSVVIFTNTGALPAQLGDYGSKLLACFREIAAEAGFTFIEK